MNTSDPAAAIVDMVFTYISWIIPGMLLLAGLKIPLLPKLRGRKGEAIVERMLKQVAMDTVHDIVLTDRKGSGTQIDHVALLPGGLLVIETKNYQGLVFGQAREHN